MVQLQAHGIVVQVQEAGLGSVTCAGVEVLRGLTLPVRNADWGTYLTETLSEETTATRHSRRFACRAGSFTGQFEVTLTEGRLVAEVAIRFAAPARINRAGFTLLHPIRGVAGQPVTLRHPDGSRTDTRFSALISPAQPARNIAGMAHVVQGVAVDIAMEGDIFEMEDQRNWSDASFKTYCRPLALPYPYAVAAGEVIRQHITLRLVRGQGGVAGVAVVAPVAARMPQVMLAQEAGLSSVAGLAGFPGLPVQLRLDRQTPDAELAALAGRKGLALEVVFDDLADLDRQVARAKAAGLHPVRVAALPRGFLKSYQPDAVWPSGAQPADAIAPLRAAFPQAAVGGGSLTNFTELNRCRPEPATVDFVTFGNTAIVHAADDLSVWQTLEALPDIFASARAIAAGRPLHLGLVSIGMRCNPYGSQTAANPDRLRLPMAMADPRQTTGFAAAYAVAILAAAARAGVESLALAMPEGPLGATGALAEVIRQAHALAGQAVTVSEAGGVVLIRAGAVALVANCTTEPQHPPGLPALAPESAICHPLPKELAP